MSSDDLYINPKDRVSPQGRQAAKTDAESRQNAESVVDPASEPEVVPDAGHGHAEGSTTDWRHKWRDQWQRHAGRLHLERLPRPVRWAGGIVAVLLIFIVLFLMIFNWDWFRPPLASILSGSLHRPVRIDGHLKVHLLTWTPTVTLGGLKIGEPTKGVADVPKQDIADIDNITVKAKLMPLFIGRLVLPRLEIDKPSLVLFQDAKGNANWDFSDGKDTGKPLKLPPIENFIINDGKLSMTSLQRKLSFTGTINAHEKDGKAAGAAPQAFGLTGNGTLNGRVFQLNATGGPLLNVHTNVPYPFNMAVTAGDTKITARGRVTHPFNLGQLDGTVSMTGRDLADLYYLTGLAMPNTPAYSISARIVRDERVYTASGINGRVGSSDLEGTLKVDMGKHGRPDLTGSLRSRSLDFKDLGSLFGATAANRPGAAHMTGTPNAPQAARRLLPDASLDAQRVRGMDADVHYRADSVHASGNMPLRQVSLGIKLDHGLMTLGPIDLSFPQGRLTGTARIDARKAVQTNAIDMRLSGLRIQDFEPRIGGAPPLEGTLNARAKLTGAGNSVHKAASSADGRVTVVIPGGTMRQSFAELMGIDATKGLFMLLSKDQHQTDVRCAIADFSVRGGRMQLQQAVFDTGVVLVNGQGSINLNDETMSMTFKGKPKKFRLIRINAPILVGGHLSSPTFGIDAGPAVVQGGIGAALSTIAAPLLALPFIASGDEKNANCSALMAEAQSHGAPTTMHAPAHR